MLGEVVFSLRSILSVIYILFFHSGGLVILLSLTIISFLSRIMFFSLAYHLTGVLYSSFKFPHLIKFCLSFNRSAVWIFLTPCAILLIVPEAMCWCFHQVSSHLLKFLLIPSIFRRSAVQILSFLFLGYTVAVSYSFVIRELLLHVFQPLKVLFMFLVPPFLPECS